MTPITLVLKESCSPKDVGDRKKERGKNGTDKRIDPCSSWASGGALLERAAGATASVETQFVIAGWFGCRTAGPDCRRERNPADLFCGAAAVPVPVVGMKGFNLGTYWQEIVAFKITHVRKLIRLRDLEAAQLIQSDRRADCSGLVDRSRIVVTRNSILNARYDDSAVQNGELHHVHIAAGEVQTSGD